MNTLFRVLAFSIFSICVFFATWWRLSYIKCVWRNFKDRRIDDRMKTANFILETHSPYDPEFDQILVTNTTQLYSWFQCIREFYQRKSDKIHNGSKKIYGNLLVQLIQEGVFKFLANAMFILPPPLAWRYEPIDRRIFNFGCRIGQWILETLL